MVVELFTKNSIDDCEIPVRTSTHCRPLPPKMLSGMNTRRYWGDWMVQLDEDRSQRVLRMSDAEWKEHAKAVITNTRGRGDLRPVMTWLVAMDAKRAEFKTAAEARPVARDMDPDAVAFRLWKDMILEPAKYGDEDWEEWLQMDAQLRCGPKRWRMAAFWLELEEEEKARVRELYATRIQAAWRGHHVRDVTPGLNCEGCLARKVSPKQFSGKHLCGGCCDDIFHCRLPVVAKPVPRTEPDEHGNVPCDGCGRVVCYEGDYGEYRPGYWCSRACAYN